MAATRPEQLAERLDTLLHTIRCIAKHEDELGTLLHEVRSSGAISAECARDLRVILEDLPAEEYAWQVNAVDMSLDACAAEMNNAA